ncbi:MAG TPA: hypothetical protein VHN18_07565 [Micromonosporaceae bacterium]|nr:hypothetical protein [Micromonosporaceae bacterium]
MPAGDLLRRLDSRLLPVLARGVVRLSQPAHRSRLLGATATFSVAAVLGTAIWAADRPPVGDTTVGEVVRVGVVAGDSIPAYVQASRAELASLARATPPTETYALVTLSEYVTPARLAPILRGVSVSEVVGRVPLPDTQTEIVRLAAERLPADAEAAMAAVADEKDREARDYRARGSAVTGNSQRERELRRLYETGATVARAEATAFRAKCGCLYAAVVRSTPAALGEITRRPGVRSVDPAPEVQRPERAVFLPPLPEQTEVVRLPTDTGLSDGAPTPSQAPVTSPGQTVAPTGPASPSGAGTVPPPTSASPHIVPSGSPPASPDSSPDPTGSPAATPTPAAPAPSGAGPTRIFFP